NRGYKGTADVGVHVRGRDETLTGGKAPQQPRDVVELLRPKLNAIWDTGLKIIPDSADVRFGNQLMCNERLDLAQDSLVQRRWLLRGEHSGEPNVSPFLDEPDEDVLGRTSYPGSQESLCLI